MNLLISNIRNNNNNNPSWFGRTNCLKDEGFKIVLLIRGRHRAICTISEISEPEVRYELIEPKLVSPILTILDIRY